MTPQERLLKVFGTSSEVARQAGVSRQCVNSWWNRGRIGWPSAARLARKSGINPSLLNREWVPVPGPRALLLKGKKATNRRKG